MCVNISGIFRGSIIIIVLSIIQLAVVNLQYLKFHAFDGSSFDVSSGNERGRLSPIIFQCLCITMTTVAALTFSGVT